MSGTSTVAVVAGSGIDLRGLLDEIEWQKPFSDFPNMAGTGVEGHPGTVTKGTMGPVSLLLQSGRAHLYEGHDIEAVTRTVDLLHELGARAIVLTNAAGGLIESMKPGDLLSVRSIRAWPSASWPFKTREIELNWVIPDCDWEGTYAWVHGPCYETPAEIRALRAFQASAVGMSTAPEVARCHALGLPVAVVSCITNNCWDTGELTHDHVLTTAHGSSQKIARVIRNELIRLNTRNQRGAKTSRKTTKTPAP